jgi:hypothetical protein
MSRTFEGTAESQLAQPADEFASGHRNELARQRAPAPPTQVKSYSRELLPACYIITNGQQIIVFQFNGMLYQDERVMDFDRSMLNDMWKDLYKYVSKESTIKRKSWMREKFQNQLAT